MGTSRSSLVVALAALATACEPDASGAGGGDEDRRSVMRVVVSTEGILQDRDGYDLSLAGTSVRVPSSWDTVLTFTDSIPRTLTLAGVNPNCAVQPSNPRTVDLVAGDTVTARLRVVCDGVPVRIAINTTGPDPDPDGYMIRLGTGRAVRVPANGEASLSAEYLGRVPVEVWGIAPNCTSDSATSVTVVLDQPLAAAIGMTCRGLASNTGSIRVKIESNLAGAVLVQRVGGVAGWAEYPVQTQGEVVIANLYSGTYLLSFGANSWGCRINNMGYEAQLRGFPVEVVTGLATDVTMMIVCIVGGP